MRFGIALESFTPPGKQPPANALFEMAEKAESWGFDSVWVWDHLLLGSRKVFPVLDSLTTLASIGARTKKIKLGTSVLILSLRNPVVVAKVLSTIQFLTNGRLMVGSASGWYEREFNAVGVPFRKRGKIYEERFKLVKALLNEKEVNYSSEGFQLQHASMEPKSDVPIPMFMGGYSKTVLNRVGALADGWISYYYGPKDFENSWQLVVQGAKNSGRDSAKLRKLDVVPLAISESFEEGDNLVKDFTSKYMDLPKNTNCSPESGVRGTVDQCISQIKEYEKAGVEDLIFIPCFYDLKQVERAGKELVPRFS